MSVWEHAASLLVLVAVLHVAFAGQSDHRYQVGDEVTVWANKVGPYRNPQEYYLFYTLPYCPPDRKIEMFEGLGEAISGYELRKTPIDLNFNSKPGTVQLCENYLLASDVKQFFKAVRNRWWFQLFVDDLPVWGNVGEVVSSGSGLEYHIYTHMHFDIAFNNDRIVEVNLTTENPIQLKENSKVVFTYSANWISTSKPFEHRFDRYLDAEFFEHQVHTYSVINSIMLEVFLIVLVLFIVMKTVKRDFNVTEDPEDDDPTEESGWKQLFSEVFRPPRHLLSLSVAVGIGFQLAVLILAVLILAKLGHYYEHRGSLASSFVICYLFTSPLAGFVSGAIYNKNKGKFWIKTMILSASVLPLTLGGVTFLLNIFAASYGSLGFVPVGTMTILAILWAVIAIPLTFAGTIFGRSFSVEKAGNTKKGKSDQQNRVNPLPRQIPEKAWYLEGIPNYLLASILPFSSIFVELYFVYSSWWHYKFFYVYGMAIIVVLLLFVTIGCISVINTFFVLSSEDYRWQWRSFCSGASVSVFVFLYSVYYYQKRTMMTGTLQLVMYFGYSLMFCLLVALACGSVSFLVASYFVKRIYQGGKFE